MNSNSSDEFRITGFKNGVEEKIWTRDSFTGAKGLAKHAVDNHGYDRVEVRNTFGGHISDPLFVYPSSSDEVR